jgi:prepilin peptidase CpaA
MTPLHIAVKAALAALVLAAAASDIRSRTIPNWLTFGGILAGFALHLGLESWPGLLFAAKGFGLAALLFLPLWFLRFFGGGDLKIMAAVATMAGPTNLLVIFILDAILGGILALAAIVVRGRVRKTLVNIGRMIRSLARGRAPYQDSEELEAGNEKSFGMPRAVSIALATLLFVWAA